MSENISLREAKAAHWREVVAEQAASGKSIRTFCAERQINDKTFNYWRYKFRDAAVKERVTGRFVAICRGGLKSTTPPRVTLPNGVTIELGDDLRDAGVAGFLLKLCGVGLGGCDAKP